MKRQLALLPILGILIFILLYFWAAALYPGGTAFDPTSVGYSHLHNFWGDLLDSVTYSDAPNPGRYYALAGTISLPLFLIFFWCLVPNLFRRKPRGGWIVRISGCLSMILVSYAFLSSHDAAVNFAFILGFIAFMATEICLFQTKEIVTSEISIAALVCSLIHFYMWQTNILLHLLPITQRCAFATFFIWIIFTSWRIFKRLPPDRPKSLD